MQLAPACESLFFSAPDGLLHLCDDRPRHRTGAAELPGRLHIFMFMLAAARPATRSGPP